MKPERACSEGIAPSSEVELPVGLGWSLGVDRRARGVSLRLRHPEQAPVDVEITITPRGPVIRARASALEIDAAEDIVARCERFSINATESVSVRAREITQQASGALHCTGAEVDVVANAGDVRVRANDDVQLLGEEILLNCEREPPLAAWIPVAPAADSLVRREDVGGDPSLLDCIEPK